MLQTPDAVDIACPWCDATLAVNPASACCTCSQCRRQVDLAAQFCFLRGTDAFSAARSFSPPRGKKKLSAADDQERTQCYFQAFTSYQQALQGELSPVQVQLAIEALADISRIFSDRMMTSPAEADYWAKLAIQRNAQQERTALQEKLAQPACYGLRNMASHWRWQIRYRQLGRSTDRLDQQVKHLEKILNLVYTPHVR